MSTCRERQKNKYRKKQRSAVGAKFFLTHFYLDVGVHIGCCAASLVSQKPSGHLACGSMHVFHRAHRFLGQFSSVCWIRARPSSHQTECHQPTNQPAGRHASLTHGIFIVIQCLWFAWLSCEHHLWQSSERWFRHHQRLRNQRCTLAEIYCWERCTVEINEEWRRRRCAPLSCERLVDHHQRNQSTSVHREISHTAGSAME